MAEDAIPALLEKALAEHKAGRIDEAADLYVRVLEREPDNADAVHLLGVAMRARGALDQAIALIRRATRLAPSMTDAWYNLGNALAAAGEHADALNAYSKAGLLDGRRIDARIGQGLARTALNDPEGAVEAYQAALAIDPAHRAARHNLATSLGECLRTEAAAGILQSLLSDHPDLAEAHYNLAHMLLRLGDYANGFAEYEWRWRTPGFPSRRLHAELPDWNGRPFDGRHLLIHTEQGLGDTIQFCRLSTTAATLGGQVTLQVPANLKRLLTGLSGVEVIGPADPLPLADMAVPLLGLAHRLGLTPGSIPWRGPYLAAEPERVERWRAVLMPDGRPIVALNPRGNPQSEADRGRSITDPSVLAPLLSHPGLRVILVEKVAPERLEPVWGGGWRLADDTFKIEHPGPEFDAGPDAFLDAAAVMTLADRVVSTDTAIAHLAGALGRPVDLMLRHAPDWRWMERRPTTPWYPDMRLHRQPTRGDWGSVVRAVRASLDDLRHGVAA